MSMKVDLAAQLRSLDPASRVYPNSTFAAGDALLAIVRVNGRKLLAATASCAQAIDGALEGQLQAVGDGVLKLCPFTRQCRGPSQIGRAHV